MLDARALSRIAAPVACAAYVAYVAFDRFAYHDVRRAEILEERRRERAAAAAAAARERR
jgi:hypothetical protein